MKAVKRIALLVLSIEFVYGFFQPTILDDFLVHLVMLTVVLCIGLGVGFMLAEICKSGSQKRYFLSLGVTIVSVLVSSIGCISLFVGTITGFLPELAFTVGLYLGSLKVTSRNYEPKGSGGQ